MNLRKQSGMNLRKSYIYIYIAMFLVPSLLCLFPSVSYSQNCPPACDVNWVQTSIGVSCNGNDNCNMNVFYSYRFCPPSDYELRITSIVIPTGQSCTGNFLLMAVEAVLKQSIYDFSIGSKDPNDYYITLYEPLCWNLTNNVYSSCDNSHCCKTTYDTRINNLRGPVTVISHTPPTSDNFLCSSITGGTCLINFCDVGNVGVPDNYVLQVGIACDEDCYWALMGNSAIDSNVNFLGTKIPEPVIFKTNNNEHMRITWSGNVGINYDLTSLFNMEAVIPTGNCFQAGIVNTSFNGQGTFFNGYVKQDGTIQATDMTHPTFISEFTGGGSQWTFQSYYMGIDEKQYSFPNGGMFTDLYDWNIFPTHHDVDPNNVKGIRFYDYDRSNPYKTINIGIGDWNPAAKLSVMINDNNNDHNLHNRTAFSVSNKAGAYQTPTSFFTVQDDGMVGIGISSPNALFHVHGSVMFDNLGTGTDISTVVADANGMLHLQSGTPSGNWSLTGNDITSSPNSVLGTTSNNPLTIVAGGPANTNTAMTILTNGNVGIGTNTPNQKLNVFGNVQIGNVYYQITNPYNNRLSVDGQVVAKDIIVSISNWSDFVFDKNYNLMKLSELEKQIQQLGHLPGIPSTKDIDEKGVNIGEMQSKLLQKVEELTLYIIQLQKDNEKIKNENIEILNKINSLTTGVQK